MWLPCRSPASAATAAAQARQAPDPANGRDSTVCHIAQLLSVGLQPPPIHLPCEGAPVCRCGGVLRPLGGGGGGRRMAPKQASIALIAVQRGAQDNGNAHEPTRGPAWEATLPRERASSRAGGTLPGASGGACGSSPHARRPRQRSDGSTARLTAAAASPPFTSWLVQRTLCLASPL